MQSPDLFIRLDIMDVNCVTCINSYRRNSTLLDYLTDRWLVFDGGRVAPYAIMLVTMFKPVTVAITLLLFMLTYSAESFRRFRVVKNRRCSNVGWLVGGGVSAHTDLQCTEACQQTADCNAFNYNKNTSVVLNCELLMTSEADYAALTPADDWSVYSSHSLLISGT